MGKLSLNQQWSSDIKQLNVGDSITRNLLITAEGAYAAQLPPLLLDNQDGLKLYSDQPQINDIDTENGVRAQRQESIAIVATKPGNYTLPAVDAWWFDTKSKRLKKASLPAVNFSVAPASNMPTTEPEITTPTPTQNNTLLPTSTEASEPELLLGLVKNTVSTWQLIALSFCGLWVITLLYALFKKSAPATEKAKPTPETTVTEQDCYKAAMQACKDNKAEKVVNLTLLWAQQHWYNSHINTIAAVKEQGAVELAEKLQALEASIYGNGGDSKTLSSDISKSISAIRKQQSNKKESDQIKPLYRNN